MMHMHHDSVDPVTLPCACTALRKASRAVGRLYDASLAPTGLNANQLAILRALGRGGPTPLSRLADAMVMDRTSLYRALRPMTADGWVAITDAPTGRTKVVALTDDGRAVMDGAAGRWEAAQSAFVGALGADEWRALHAILGGVIATAAATRLAPAGEVRP
jgi:DNA-binding MarR family transcriptional regulator